MRSIITVNTVKEEAKGLNMVRWEFPVIITAVIPETRTNFARFITLIVLTGLRHYNNLIFI